MDEKKHKPLAAERGICRNLPPGGPGIKGKKNHNVGGRGRDARKKGKDLRGKKLKKKGHLGQKRVVARMGP